MLTDSLSHRRGIYRHQALLIFIKYADVVKPKIKFCLPKFCLSIHHTLYFNHCCRLITYRQRFARAAPAPRANRGRASPVKIIDGRFCKKLDCAQETFRTAGSSTNDLFLIPHISMRGALHDWLLKSRARVLIGLNPSCCS